MASLAIERRPYRLPTHEMPTGRQFRGRQFMRHQSTGLPTLIMKTYFYMFWQVKTIMMKGKFVLGVEFDVKPITDLCQPPKSNVPSGNGQQQSA